VEPQTCTLAALAEGGQAEGWKGCFFSETPSGANVIRKTNEQGYGGSRVLGGISLWF